MVNQAPRSTANQHDQDLNSEPNSEPHSMRSCKDHKWQGSKSSPPDPPEGAGSVPPARGAAALLLGQASGLQAAAAVWVWAEPELRLEWEEGPVAGTSAGTPREETHGEAGLHECHVLSWGRASPGDRHSWMINLHLTWSHWRT